MRKENSVSACLAKKLNAGKQQFTDGAPFAAEVASVILFCRLIVLFLLHSLVFLGKGVE